MAKIQTIQPTAQEMIESAMTLIGALDQGRSAAPRELSAGIVALNEMIESWNLRRILLYETSREHFTLTPSLNPHTIGLSVNGSGAGDLAIARPPSIQSASIKQGGSNTEFPIRILSKEEYQRIPTKGTTGSRPRRLWYEREWPLGKIFLYPIPGSASILYLNIWKQLDSGMELADKFSVPPGYLRALRYNLALELAPELRSKRANIDRVDRIARESRSAIEDINNDEPSYVRADPSLPGLGSGSNYDIQSGEYDF